MKVGDFITATLKGGNNGEARQGVLVADKGDELEVLGESGTLYTCYRYGAVVVPDKNLFSSTKDFVLNWRTANAEAETA